MIAEFITDKFSGPISMDFSVGLVIFVYGRGGRYFKDFSNYHLRINNSYIIDYIVQVIPSMV